ncbi:MAG: signal peptidase I [Parachlamydiaceae bacterium]|nr:signal peptidase I [Parachlamydiaceae bacterium]
MQKFEGLLANLDQAVLSKNEQQANLLAHETDEFCENHFKKNMFEYGSELVFAIAIALIIAVIVRQSWFELMEIPTGSMRPTFKEQDHLTVTKTTFGINIPLLNNHFYFDPNLVQRTGIVIWSGEGIPNLETDTTFMGIFPSTKRFVKRCMGKPGDTLYFYGGKVFGFDIEGNDLIELRNSPWIQKLEHIPFDRFDGRESIKEYRNEGKVQLTYHHFNKPVGRLFFSREGFKGEVFNGKDWVKDNPLALLEPHTSIQTFSDWWGIRNFAMARLLNKEQLETLTSYQANEFDENALLYLELRHTPSLTYPSPLLYERGIASIRGFSTIIPMQEKHLLALMNNMYTCRFVIENEHGSSYGSHSKNTNLLTDLTTLLNRFLGKETPSKKNIQGTHQPLFANVQDGTYEFYYGKGLQVNWGAITSVLPSNNPLLSKNIENIQKLYNVGIDMNNLVSPLERNQLYFPSRYVYFRDGDLYTMGGKIFEKSDEILQNFHLKEQEKEKKSSKQHPYIAFKDYGPPLKEDGTLDKDFIKTFGYKVPNGMYLMLGDNHAMSKDSRYFGPVPQNNLEGSPSIILWPPGERWGFPNQKPYPIITIPRLIVWSVVALILLSWFLIYRYYRNKPVFKKL